MTIKSDISLIKKEQKPIRSKSKNNLTRKKFIRYKKNLNYDNEYVYSYGTPVAKIQNGTLVKLGYWSVTTSKHINYAGKELGLKVINNTK